MTDRTHTTDVAFTPAVKAVQEALGTRRQMAVMASRRGFRTAITADLAAYLARVESFFLATATADGQPYIQHRGGPAGFLEVVDETTLRFADYPGNRQFLTLGNLSENDRVHLFLIDYETKTRIKIWGRGRVVDMDGGRAIEVTVEAWDPNCPQYLPALYSEATVQAVTRKLSARIAELEAQVAALSAGTGGEPS